MPVEEEITGEDGRPKERIEQEEKKFVKDGLRKKRRNGHVRRINGEVKWKKHWENCDGKIMKFVKERF